jgi:hypothetical protein
MPMFRDALVTALAILWVVPTAILVLDVILVALAWPMANKNPGQHGSDRRRIAANIAKLPDLLKRPQY